ncbi:hypothetical protein ACC794_02895 [Rhizobium ruizarguesonis]
MLPTTDDGVCPAYLTHTAGGIAVIFLATNTAVYKLEEYRCDCWKSSTYTSCFDSSEMATGDSSPAGTWPIAERIAHFQPTRDSLF